ncbi:hypothetical protein [Chitinophaga vietnamensis]|uniref:hypothetical protein n=1 Tax=Chitinophaga vietnamensis TaxID=2593957 RepID=UPI0011779B1B|nr:hypothetical protein [Chitinophaga vietnamensis]
MNTALLTNAAVKAAIAALQAGDSHAWYACFTPDATLTDDGRQINFHVFFDQALGHEKFISIDKVEEHGLAVYGRYHSDQWGEFKTFFRFRTNGASLFSGLEIGQANY